MAIDKDNPMFPGFDVEPSAVDVELQDPMAADAASVTFDEEGGALIDLNPPGVMAHGSAEFTRNLAEDMDEGDSDLDEASSMGYGDAGNKKTSGKDAGYTPAKTTKGSTGYDAGSKALQERFQKLANIIK